MSTPSTSTSVEDSPAPRAQSTADPDHVNTVNTGFQPEHTAASDTAELHEHAWTRAPIEEWSHQVTIEFLEHYKIKAEGMATALSMKCDGRTLREIVRNDECNAILTEDLGINNRMHRIALIAAVTAGMEFKRNPSETNATGASVTRKTLPYR